MNKILVILSCLLLSFGASAHQPDLSSTMLVEQGANKWVLQIRAALTAFEYEIHQRFGEGSYATPEEFQDLVLGHVKDNFSILPDGGNNVRLQNGMVKLGHETSVVFQVLALPENMQSLEVKNSSFKNIYHNQSALIVLKEGFEKQQFVLDNSNEHTAKLKLAETKFELVTNTQNPLQAEAEYFSFWFLLLPFIGLVIYLVYRQTRKT